MVNNNWSSDKASEKDNKEVSRSQQRDGVPRAYLTHKRENCNRCIIQDQGATSGGDSSKDYVHKEGLGA